MSIVRLMQLKLTNFQGIRNFTLDTNGKNISIFGDNGVGKTTIFNGFLWALFGKDSQGQASFDIKTLTPEGEPIHGLDHSAELYLDINGQGLTLKKTYRELWQKKRGSAKETFTGHSTDYYINDVPIKKSEYESRIHELVDENVFRLLTNPRHFNTHLKWQDRRKILLEVCGDLSDEDVIASDRSLSKLPEILQGRKLEDHRKVIAAKRAEINKELEKIPVRIDEAQLGLPDVSNVDSDELSSRAAFLKARAQEKNKEISRIQSGGEIAEKIKTLREIESRLIDIKNVHRSEVGNKTDIKRGENGQVTRKIDALKNDVAGCQSVIKRNKNSIALAENEANKLRKEWHTINDLQFIHSQECVCPACGQQLPEERLTEAREKVLASFNLAKSQGLETTTTKGKRLKSEIEKLQAENDSLENSINDTEKQLEVLEQKSADLQIEIDDMLRGVSDIAGFPAYVQALKDKETVEGQINSLSSGNAGSIALVRAEVTSLEAEIGIIEKSLSRVDQYNKGQKRIEELKAQERTLAAEYERLEGELYLTEQFIRAKVRLLEDKINSRFKMARFRLFDVQINGGLTECCETIVGGVPYSSGLNNAAKINVGLDIINTLSEHYSFIAPIFIDNAEAVVEAIPTRGQMIKLVVSGVDKKLRIEVEPKIKAEVA